MKIIKQSHEILQYDDIKLIELAGRTCYKSEGNITEDSAKKFVKGLINRKHMAMIEFGGAAVKLITDRGVTHEQVRHRLASYGQESTRFVRYGDIDVIQPVIAKELSLLDKAYNVWHNHMLSSEKAYKELLDLGWKPEFARSVLPNSLKTEIVVKCSYREWRHIFELRVLGITGKPHPQIQQLLEPVLRELNEKVPVVFEDLVETLDNKK